MLMKKDNIIRIRIFRLFLFFNLIYFLFSSFFWMVFLFPVNILSACFSVLLILSCLLSIRQFQLSNQTLILFFILILLSIWSLLSVGISYGVLTFFSYLSAILLFILPVDVKHYVLNYVTKWFSIIMLISVCIFLITRIITVPAPLGVFQIDELRYDPFNNYILFIESQSIFNTLIYRFNGPFLEPGHLAVVCALIITANKYEFKKNKWLWILLLSIILSLSLAGYVILFLGYLLFKVKSYRLLLLSGIAVGGFLVFTIYIWNDGDNPVNALIFSRLEYDEEKGVAGNNRTSEQTDVYFQKNLENGNLWIGLGSQEQDAFIAGAGYKIFFLRYGIIAAILVACFYYNLIPRHANIRYSLAFLFLIVVIFIQRAYPSWYSWLLAFTLGCGTTVKRSRCYRINGVSHRNICD